MGERARRVAVVGSGPSGMYAAGHLAEHPAGTWVEGALTTLAPGPVEVDIYERLPTPWGLVRNGVAPDHPHKKQMSNVFDAIAARPGVRFLGNVEVGRDVSTDELSEWYDAVIYAVGAAEGRRLDIPGRDLPGSWTAHDFVAWYNGHPDYADLGPDLSGDRAVVIGNGNVSLDVARVLSLTPDQLARTDIAPHAEAALRRSSIREVVIVGRRGPAHAAFTNPELEELITTPHLHLTLEPDGILDQRPETRTAAPARRARLLAEISNRDQHNHSHHIRFLFNHTPTQVSGRDTVESIDLTATEGGAITLDTSLVVAAIGYASAAVPGLPFDDRRRIVPNLDGRVDQRPGVYVTGWVKRGPSGVIGTNKWCSRETVRALFDDINAGILPATRSRTHDEVVSTLRERGCELVQWPNWRVLDAHEQARGRAALRPRIKETTRVRLLAHAKASAS